MTERTIYLWKCEECGDTNHRTSSREPRRCTTCGSRTIYLWKCEECGDTNHRTSSREPRRCTTCGSRGVMSYKGTLAEKEKKGYKQLHTPILLMLVGIPGSGKSSWLKTFKGTSKNIFINNSRYTLICPDAIRQSMGDIHDQTRNIAVWQEAKKHTVEYLKQKMNVILDATNVNTKLRRQFLEDLPPCQKLAKIFTVNPDLACIRIKQDIKEKKHRADVPEEVIYRMYGEFLYTLKVIASEGFQFID
jgi:predicted kinase/DNA-directed RNA polymerase subunit RPC12/RpoP